MNEQKERVVRVSKTVYSARPQRTLKDGLVLAVYLTGGGLFQASLTYHGVPDRWYEWFISYAAIAWLLEAGRRLERMFPRPVISEAESVTESDWEPVFDPHHGERPKHAD